MTRVHHNQISIDGGKPLGPITLYVLSDSTGSLGRHMVTSFLTQFPAGSFQVLVKPFVNEPRRLTEAFAAMLARPGIVLHAVVSPEIKHEITGWCLEMGSPCFDLTGPVVNFLGAASHIGPKCDARSLHPVDESYCGRINAMSFALEHDDGLGLDSLGEADIILAGVSRTGKTPTSMYLAMQGFRVANVSLAVEVAVPPQLSQASSRKIVGLTIDPRQLAEIRTRRQTGWRMSQTRYNEPLEVQRELEWSRRQFAKLRCPVLDVTDQAIEETAARIVDLLGLTEPARCAAAEELS
jgi:[pyruvate, water dikinase]-phosphate phosphotransferase / [pyruvate, water dikinase] kinase